MTSKIELYREVLALEPASRVFFPLANMLVDQGGTDEAMDAFLAHALQAAEDGVRLKCRPSREAEIFGSMPDRLWSLLSKVRTPVHVLHAEQTFPFVSESVARWSRLNDHVSTEQVAGGHCFMQERPAEAAQLVAAQLLPRLEAVPA